LDSGGQYLPSGLGFLSLPTLSIRNYLLCASVALPLHSLRILRILPILYLLDLATLLVLTQPACVLAAWDISPCGLESS